MEYKESDFLETADEEMTELSTKCRELTREYYLCDYRDQEKKEAILKELFGSVGENPGIGTPIYCDQIGRAHV